MGIMNFLLDHYVMIISVIGLWSMTNISVHVKPQTLRATRVTIILILLEAILWSIEQWTQTFTTPTIARALLTATIYLLHPIILIAMMNIPEQVGIKRQILLVLPIIISAFVLYSSQWTHLVFWIKGNNTWTGAYGVARYYPYILFALYMLIFMIRFVYSYRNYPLRSKIGILYILISTAVIVVLHVVSGRDTDYTTLFALALILYYLFLYVNYSKTDQLTHMMNRYAYYKEGASHFRSITGMVSADMNELKWINDTKGHAAGDEALKTVSKILMTGANQNKTCYRLGGDEFSILYKNASEKEIQADIEKMRAALAKTPYVCAFGYTMKKGQNFEEMTLEADRLMYKNKSDIKQKILEEGGTLHHREDSSTSK